MVTGITDQIEKERKQYMAKSISETPRAPMGWNSYDYYDTTVSEAQVRANAEYMAGHLKDHGWEYVVIDISWFSRDAGTRRSEHQYIPFGDMQIDAYGRLQPDENRFPSSAGGKGFAPLADYIHSLGLKFGIHIMRGIPRIAAHQHMPVFGTGTTANEAADPNSICPWNPDMYGVKETPAGQAYYDSIIKMYAGWGVDFIKCDDICHSSLYPGPEFSGWGEIKMIRKAIDDAGRDIVLSLSPGPAHIDLAWFYAKNANMWRITDDFWDNWDALANMFFRCELWQDHVKPGCRPDCDMLPLGMVGKGFGQERKTCFTPAEQITMMTLWCIFGSPLMLGAELTKLDDFTLSLLTNDDVLRLTGDDYKGRQEERTKDHAVWSCQNPLTGEKYIALFNLSAEEQVVSFDFRGAEGFSDCMADCNLKELWTRNTAAADGTTLSADIEGHGAKLYRLIV